jgi:outer membrane protein assembly factor BamB
MERNKIVTWRVSSSKITAEWGCPMLKKKTVSMQTIGYLLLWVGIILLLVRGCTFALSLGNVVSPGPSSPPQPGLISASVENGMVYFVANNNLHALRSSDGKQIWQGFSNIIDPPVVANGVVYEINFGEIEALSGSDGGLLWRYNSSNEGEIIRPGTTQIVQVADKRIYLYDGQVLDVLVADSGIAGTGRSAWSSNDIVNAVDINTLTISNGVVYYAVHPRNDATTTPAAPDNTIVARRALDGKTLWTYSASVAGQPCAITSMVRALEAVYASASCNNGVGRTFALRASDGALLWQSSISGQFSVTNGVVCLHITQGSPTLADLYVLQASSGKLLWQDQPGTSQQQTQVWTPGNGYIYILDNGTLNARRLSDGQPAWNMGFSSDATSQTFETFSDPVFLGALNNIVYLQSSVVNQNTHVAFNRMYALQASTGKQLWSFQQDQFNLTWSTVSINATTGIMAVQGLDSRHPTAFYLLRASDGGLMGSLLQSQAASTIQIVNDIVYITSISGDGNNTPFRYLLRALNADNIGDTVLWGFEA